MTDNAVLDRPAWSALKTRQTHFAEGGARAVRYPCDVSPFAAARDDSPQSLDDLAALVPRGGQVALVQVRESPVPAGLSVAMAADGVQMVAGDLRAPPHTENVIVLGDDDAPEMVELAALTKPGPFLPRTHKMGDFVGIRSNGRLAAMAGERLKPGNYTEVSGVCTHPDFRGRGYGGLLSMIVAQRIVERGEIPMLHAFAENAAAIRLYEAIGFRHNRDMKFQLLKRE